MLCNRCGESWTGTSGVSAGAGDAGLEPAADTCAAALDGWDSAFAAGLAARECHEKPAKNPANAMLPIDRKSTRLNSSHRCISYAVFCLKKKNTQKQIIQQQQQQNTKNNK